MKGKMFQDLSAQQILVKKLAREGSSRGSLSYRFEGFQTQVTFKRLEGGGPLPLVEEMDS